MICVSIQNKSASGIEAILSRVEMAEIRLDLCDLSDEDIERVFLSDTPTIATCRAIDGDYARTERLLCAAVKAGADFVDLEMEAPKPVSKRIAAACAQWGSVLIRSYHDFSGTPSIDCLKEIVDKCRHHDGEIVKIVTTARCPSDVDAVLGLYRYYTAESLVAFAMPSDEGGESEIELSQSSRLECLRLGAPFSYACPDGESATAPGQIPYSRMYDAVYGSFRRFGARKLRMPSSKSFAQRAIVCAALAEGTSVLRGYTPCNDSEAAISLVKQMGAKVVRKRGTLGTSTLEITGTGAASGAAQRMNEHANADGNDGITTLNMGESGLLTRLMLPLACHLYSRPVRFEGCGTLLSRTLEGAGKAMSALGADCPGDDLTIPFTVQGPLKPGRIVLDGSRSSQLVSGALMALPLSSRNSSISVQHPTSIPYIYITADVLRHFGVKLRSEMYGGRQLLDSDWNRCTEIVLKIKENQTYKPCTMDIEGDWSAAAVFLAAGAIFGETALDGLDTSSIQADISIVDLLIDAGASLSQMDEPKGTIVVKKAPLRSIRADLSNCPDLFPVLSVFCAFCEGTSTLSGLHRLTHKESDRSEGILDMLSGLGVQARVKGDSLFVEGRSLAARILGGRMLRGGKFTSSHDHRMVMALSLASLGASSPIEIDDVECVAKSYPDFISIWNKLEK